MLLTIAIVLAYLALAALLLTPVNPFATRTTRRHLTRKDQP